MNPLKIVLLSMKFDKKMNINLIKVEAQQAEGKIGCTGQRNQC